jgi:hypothetical protein
MQMEEILAQVEGPKGVAEIVEAPPTAGIGGGPEYEIRFQGKAYRYMTLGEAYIEAGALAGTLS